MTVNSHSNYQKTRQNKHLFLNRLVGRVSLEHSVQSSQSFTWFSSLHTLHQTGSTGTSVTQKYYLYGAGREPAQLPNAHTQTTAGKGCVNIAVVLEALVADKPQILENNKIKIREI